MFLNVAYFVFKAGFKQTDFLLQLFDLFFLIRMVTTLLQRDMLVLLFSKLFS